MALYKYVIADRKDILKNGLIRFTQPAALNDPWEMKPYIERLMADELWESEIRAKALEAYDPGDAVKKAAEDMWRKLNRQQRRARPLHVFEAELKALVKNNTGVVKELYLKYFNAAVDMAVARQEELVRMIPDLINKTLGILSLAENPTHRLMWSHYAGTYSGFVLAFDEGHGFFNARRTSEDELNFLRKVVYSGERPSMKAFMDFSEEHLASIATKMFLTKGEEWTYEREWRMVKALKDADKVIEIPDGNIHLYALPPDCITGITLGHRMKLEDRDEIIEMMKGDTRYRHVSLSETVLSETSYDVEVKPIELN